MKALKRKNHQLMMEDCSVPKIGPKQVLIKVLMAGICRTDQYVGNGTIQVKEPRILGHEFCGLVAKDSSNYKQGQTVTVNPLAQDLSFIGIDHDGCFAEYVAVPEDQVYPINTHNLKLAAYIEPIAASLAPLKALSDKNQLVHIFGTNRIAQLTALILQLEGYKTQLIAPNSLEANSCDIVIETLMDEASIAEITKILKPQGLLILKSRFPNKVPVNLYEFVKKEIKIESCYYYDFVKSIEFALSNEAFFDQIFGQDYDLSDFEEAFNQNNKGEKKIFFKF